MRFIISKLSNLIILFYFFCNFALAASEFKTLTMEWEPVAGSFGYEIDVYQLSKQNGSKNIGMYKVKSTEWKAELTPGKYQFRIRTLDIRGVPGVWGEMIPFSVTAPAPELLKPSKEFFQQSNQESDDWVDFEWKQVTGATSYSLEVTALDNSEVIKLETIDPNYKLKLPVGRKYSWRVISLDDDKNEGDPTKEEFTFILSGRKIIKPEIITPENEFETILRWTKPNNASNYDYLLERKNLKGTWETVEQKKSVQKNEFEIPQKIKGGQFRLKVKAHGMYRISSDIATLEFPVYDGDRSVQGIETAKIRQAMEKDKNKYLIASYLISYLRFNGENRESGNRLSYSVLGGTGRLGYGFMPKGKWGFVGILDYSGVTINKKNYTYSSIEAQAVWRSYIGIGTQVRVFGGVFIKELPESSAFDSQDVVVTNIQQMGPLLGSQVWMSLTSKYGLQINAQTNLGLIKLKTPNNRALSPSVTYQLGVLGSYKWRSNITGFAGVAYRVDSAKYLATTNDGSNVNSFAQEGDLNTVSLIGTYLNLYAEWGF